VVVPPPPLPLSLSLSRPCLPIRVMRVLYERGGGKPPWPSRRLGVNRCISAGLGCGLSRLQITTVKHGDQIVASEVWHSHSLTHPPTPCHITARPPRPEPLTLVGLPVQADVTELIRERDQKDVRFRRVCHDLRVSASRWGLGGHDIDHTPLDGDPVRFAHVLTQRVWNCRHRCMELLVWPKT
jgi:hypothetical protein